MSMYRYFHACSSFTFDDELILAVVGGVTDTSPASYWSNSSEFLSYYSEAPKWDNRGTELDLHSDYNYGQLLVSNGETLFYINTMINTFYRLEHTFQGGFEWIRMNLSLETPRQYAIGVLISDELANCTKTAIN